MDRRSFLGAIGVTLGAYTLRHAEPELPDLRVPGLRQSVARWPFEKVPLDEFCRGVRSLGLGAVDLLYPDEWAIAAGHGLMCSMGYASRRRAFLTEGWNDRAHHDMLVAEVTAALPRAAAAGVPNLIVMSGNRRGRPVQEGIRNCAEGLKQVTPLAERAGVILCMEMLNSRVDHPDYDADSTRYGVDVVQQVGSSHFRLLYDIYHMQIMEGNLVHTIRSHRDAIVHFHTAGVPGRHELDQRQELNYPAIAHAIRETGFTGWLAHEFIPTRHYLDGLREAVEVCS